jgi:hypothetical protein
MYVYAWCIDRSMLQMYIYHTYVYDVCICIHLRVCMFMCVLQGSFVISVSTFLIFSYLGSSVPLFWFNCCLVIVFSIIFLRSSLRSTVSLWVFAKYFNWVMNS